MNFLSIQGGIATPSDEPMKTKGPFMGPSITQTTNFKAISSGVSVDTEYKSVMDSVMGK